MASLTISLCLEIPRRLDLLRIRLKGRKLNNEKGGVSRPQKERIGTSNPSFSGAKDGKFCFQEFLRLVALKMFFLRQHLLQLVSLQPQDMEDLFGGVFLSWMFSRCGISPTVFDRQSKKKLLMIFCLKKKVEKEPLECTISFSSIYGSIFSTPQVDKAQTQPIYESLDSALALAFALTLAFAFAFAWISWRRRRPRNAKCHIIKEKILYLRPLCSNYQSTN